MQSSPKTMSPRSALGTLAVRLVSRRSLIVQSAYRSNGKSKSVMSGVRQPPQQPSLHNNFSTADEAPSTAESQPYVLEEGYHEGYLSSEDGDPDPIYSRRLLLQDNPPSTSGRDQQRSFGSASWNSSYQRSNGNGSGNGSYASGQYQHAQPGHRRTGHNRSMSSSRAVQSSPSRMGSQQPLQTSNIAQSALPQQMPHSSAAYAAPVPMYEFPTFNKYNIFNNVVLTEVVSKKGNKDSVVLIGSWSRTEAADLYKSVNNVRIPKLFIQTYAPPGMPLYTMVSKHPLPSIHPVYGDAVGVEGFQEALGGGGSNGSGSNNNMTTAPSARAVQHQATASGQLPAAPAHAAASSSSWLRAASPAAQPQPTTQPPPPTASPAPAAPTARAAKPSQPTTQPSTSQLSTSQPATSQGQQRGGGTQAAQPIKLLITPRSRVELEKERILRALAHIQSSGGTLQIWTRSMLPREKRWVQEQAGLKNLTATITGDTKQRLITVQQSLGDQPSVKSDSDSEVGSDAASDAGSVAVRTIKHSIARIQYEQEAIVQLMEEILASGNSLQLKTPRMLPREKKWIREQASSRGLEATISGDPTCRIITIRKAGAAGGPSSAATDTISEEEEAQWGSPSQTSIIQYASNMDRHRLSVVLQKRLLAKKSRSPYVALVGSLPVDEYKWLCKVLQNLDLNFASFVQPDTRAHTMLISPRTLPDGDHPSYGRRQEAAQAKQQQQPQQPKEDPAEKLKSLIQEMEAFKVSDEIELLINCANRTKKWLDVASSMGLHAKFYGCDGRVTFVVSREPLPEYRAEFDPIRLKDFSTKLSNESHKLIQQALAAGGERGLNPQASPDQWYSGEEGAPNRWYEPSPPPRTASQQYNRYNDDYYDSEDEGEDPLTLVRDLGGYPLKDWQQQQQDLQELRQAAQERERQRRLQQRMRQNRALSRELQALQEEARATEQGQAMLAARSQLPAFQERARALQLLRDNQVLLISGDTGCGKSTQVPQFLLESEIEAGRGGAVNIVVTQPRRISAVALANRVAEERCERTGDVIGFKVRNDTKTSRRTRLTFCTTGVLLRRLLAEPTLDEVTCIVVDEVHERKINEDFLLIILKDLLPRRPDLKLVLMSATVNADLFRDYFAGCQWLHIPGRTFPVEHFFLEDVLQATGYCVPTEEEQKQMDAARANRLLDAALAPDRANAAALCGSASALREQREAEAARLRKERVKDVVRQHNKYDWHRGYSVEASDYRGYDAHVVESLRTWMNYKEDKVHLGLAAATIKYICENEPEGAILVFLTGWDEIAKLSMLLAEDPLTGDASRVMVLPVHSALTMEAQQLIFGKMPDGVRKVVLATNIAETSITIPDVVYVVDGGRAKERAYDTVNKLSTILPGWISKASAKQRMGRAGRVQPGRCYRLYPGPMFEQAFGNHELPELLRTPLAELCLQIKYLGIENVGAFLSKAINPPGRRSVVQALEQLASIGALEEPGGEAGGKLTPLGRHLAQLPVDPSTGKMLITGAIFGCLDSVLTIAASMSARDLFVRSMDSSSKTTRKIKLAYAGSEISDHLASLEAYQTAREEGKLWCRENGIDTRAVTQINDMRVQFAELLYNIGFLVDPDADEDDVRWSRGGQRRVRRRSDRQLLQIVERYSEHADDVELLKGIMVAGMFPQVAAIQQKKKKGYRFATLEDGVVLPHPNSVMWDALQGAVDLPHRWGVYSDKVKTTNVYLRHCTIITDVALLLFGGQLVPEKPGQLAMWNGMIKFHLPPAQANLVTQVRSRVTELLEAKLQRPWIDLHEQSQPLVQLIRDVLSNENAPIFAQKAKSKEASKEATAVAEQPSSAQVSSASSAGARIGGKAARKDAAESPRSGQVVSGNEGREVEEASFIDQEDQAIGAAQQQLLVSRRKPAIRIRRTVKPKLAFMQGR